MLLFCALMKFAFLISHFVVLWSCGLVMVVFVCACCWVLTLLPTHAINQAKCPLLNKDENLAWNHPTGIICSSQLKERGEKKWGSNWHYTRACKHDIVHKIRAVYGCLEN